MARRQYLGPLDPIFDIETKRGAPLLPGNSPATGLIPVTIEEQPGQPDPVVGDPVLFDVVFEESVSGFTGSDVSLSGEAGATTAAVSGSGDTYEVEVTGMTIAGRVIARILGGKVTGDISGDTNRASTSFDNIVNWEPFPLPPWAQYWDFSNLANWNAGTLEQVPEIGTLNMKRIDGSFGGEVSTINGLQCASNNGGFLSGRREWGTDAGLPAITPPYGIGVVYQFINGVAAANGQVIALATDNSPAGQRKPTIVGGLTGNQPTGIGTSTLTATTAPGDINPHVAFLYVDDPGSKLFIDGTLQATGSLGLAALSAGARVVWITGREADGSGPAGGAASPGWKAGEGGLAMGSHTDTMILNWMNDMITKWGI